MEENLNLIYGMELQARALAPQYGEANEVRFLLATNSLHSSNQVHLLEYNEDAAAVNAKIFAHPLGEVWKLTSSPHDARTLISCYNVEHGSQVHMQAALLTMPEQLDQHPIDSEFMSWQNVEVLHTEEFGNKVKTTEFHPLSNSLLACVVDNKIVLFERAEAQTRLLAEMSAKHAPHFTTGKWSQHQQGNQFIALHDCGIKAFDLRDIKHVAWSIEEAHGQLVRDLDCNPNKQCHIVTGGDDGYVKVWDYRQPKEALFARNDHAHWVWCVRFNTFHDQLILSSSSDCKVLLTCAGSVSSESAGTEAANTSGSTTTSGNDSRKQLEDGLLQTFDQHEDSVYCVEWSNVDPWVFASLSYDGRLLISKVPKQYKYQIII